MIPYDDLVVALQTWRARQGLPVAQLSGSLTPPPPAPAPAPAPMKAGPPSAPPGRATPPPLAAVEPAHDLEEDASLLEEAHYENEGDDFALAFNASHEVENDAESTAIGVGPSRDSFGGSTQPEPPPSPGRKRNDW